LKKNAIKQDAKNRLAFEGKDWKVYIGGGYYAKKLSFVVMGNVAYPLDSSHFSGPVALLIDTGVLLYVGRGAVDFPPSREALKYTKHTIATIHNRITDIISELKTKIENDIASCQYEWDARSKFLDLSAGNLRCIYNIVAPVVKYKGKDISNKSYLDEKDGVDTRNFVSFSRNRYRQTISQSSVNNIAVSLSTKFVVNDLSNKGYSAVRRHLQDTKTDDTLFLFYNENITESKDAIKYIVDTLGVNPKDILYTSSFPKSVKTTRVPGVKKADNMLPCRVLSSNSYHEPPGTIRRSRWEVSEVDMDKGTYYYVIINKSDTTTMNKTEYESSTFRRIADACGCTDLSQFVGLTPLRYEKIKDKKNWKPFEEFPKNHLDKWHSIDDNVKSIEVSNSREIFERYKKLKPFLNNNTKLYSFLDSFNGLKDSKEVDSIANLISSYERLVGQKYVRPKSNFTISTDFLSDYPMLSLIDSDVIQGSYYTKPKTENLKAVADYINKIG
jgi:hypothetical protein